MSKSIAAQRIATRDIFSFLALILSWELEIAVLALQLFTPARLDLVTHLVFAALSISFTVLWLFTGRRKLREYRTLGLSATLTFPQMLMVTVFIVAIGTVGGLLIFRMVHA